MFHGGRGDNDDVKSNQKHPVQHSGAIRGALGRIRQHDEEVRRLRAQFGLPNIPAGRGFLLKLPDGVDVDQLTHALGVEFVAETGEGLMLVSSEDLQFTRLEEVLKQFESQQRGGGSAASLLDIYEKPDDPRRLQNILAEEIKWPLDDNKVYIFDLGIQTATSTRDVKWPRVKKKKSETAEQFQQRREENRNKARIAADTEWQDKADVRVTEVQDLTQHYGGELIGISSDPSREGKAGIVFPDSVQVRIKMNGKGFKDVILNFPHLFDVSVPPELQQPGGESLGQPAESQIVIQPPAKTAPTVCVIDSGIEEGHRWLEPAIDSDTSRCFLPGVQPDDVADYFQPQGHGTRVAGAILYPTQIPTAGEVEPVAWIQNARVLDANNQLPEALPPEDYLQKVVAHFHAAPRFTKIFNHSINAKVPCPKQRMTSWAAKLDQLSHEQEVLFIQSSGNQDRHGSGDQANPGLSAHLDAGKQPPDHQLESSMRVANPAQSLHVLTVGSVSAEVFDDANSRSFATAEHHPSGFSRAGYGEPWSVVKPEVVEVGGDLIYSKNSPRLVRRHADVAIELLNSTMHGAPAYSCDGAGTSFAAPKVAYIAAHLQNLFPDASPLLYRALIVQSARWPAWAGNETDTDKVLKLIGYGLPSLERATTNATNRVTLITPDAETLPSKQLHLYTIRIPDELRNAALEAKIRIDVTLAYTALPRRTRARRTGYLETWLDWESSKLGEPVGEFLNRMQNGGKSTFDEFPWTLHKGKGFGEAEETCRTRGTVQKDWATFDSFNLPEEFAIAVRSHIGWNHLKEAAKARYCLVVSFEVVEGEVPIYSLIESEIQVTEAETEVRVQT